MKVNLFLFVVVSIWLTLLSIWMVSIGIADLKSDPTKSIVHDYNKTVEEYFCDEDTGVCETRMIEAYSHSTITFHIDDIRYVMEFYRDVMDY